MTTHKVNSLQSWPIAIACALFALGFSFTLGWHFGQQQVHAVQLNPMAQELGELETLLTSQQRTRAQQLSALQTQLAQQQNDTAQSSSVLRELEQWLTQLQAEHEILLSAYSLLEHQLSEREALLEQWLSNAPKQTP